MSSERLLARVNEASGKWKAAFNSGNAAGCAEQYQTDALIVAKPFGTFRGTTEIQNFWQGLINQGFAEVEYVAPTKLEPQANGKSVLLSSHWKMNKAKGIITKELWVIQQDGSAKLKEDHFEVTG